MLHTWGSVLERLKDKYSKDMISKEQLMSWFDWLIKEERIKLIMMHITHNLSYSDRSLKDIPEMLTEEQKKLLEDNWGEFCRSKGITVENRLKQKIKYSLECMADYKPKEILARDDNSKRSI